MTITPPPPPPQVPVSQSVLYRADLIITFSVDNTVTMLTTSTHPVSKWPSWANLGHLQ